MYLIPLACSKVEVPEPPTGIQIDLAALPLDKLSDYPFFTGALSNHNPVEGVLPYDLNTPLFSDYAGKLRFVWMPENRKANYTEDGVLQFPLGTVLIKTFYFDNDIRDPSLGRRILETRLLVKQDTAWQPISYIWNDAQTDADFSVVGAQVPVEWIHYDGNVRTANYLIPNKNECKGCHNLDSKLVPIGPKVRNLNKDYDYAAGTMNQLLKWESQGYLNGIPSPFVAPSVPDWEDPGSGTLSDRARAYLDLNCAHCHNIQGPAKNSGLLLTYEETDSTALGICKPPVAAGQGAGNLEYGIVPGQPDQSIVVFRMESTEPEIAMPELARSVLHDEGIQLIKDWIASLEGDCE